MKIGRKFGRSCTGALVISKRGFSCLKLFKALEPCGSGAFLLQNEKENEQSIALPELKVRF